MATTEGTNGRDPGLRLFHVASRGWGARRLLRKLMRDAWCGPELRHQSKVFRRSARPLKMGCSLAGRKLESRAFLSLPTNGCL